MTLSNKKDTSLFKLPFLWIRFDGPAFLVLSLFLVIVVEFTLQLKDSSVDGTLTRSTIDLTFAAAYTLLLSILLAVSFELYYFISRFLGSLLLRFESVWNFAAPAIAVFLLTGEPILRSFFLEKQVGPTEIVSAIVSPGILILLFLFPVFRGMNATFLLSAASISRILLLPVEISIESPFDFAIFQLVAYWLSATIFLVLQNRRRLGLSPYYEIFRVPGKYIWIGVVISIISGFVFVYHRNQQSALAVIHFLATTSIVFWVLSSIRLNHASLNQSRSIRPGLLAGFLLVVVGFSGYQSFALKTPDRVFRICSYGGLTCEMLSFSGLVLDPDGDNNSLWPGDDPDSTDSTVRADFTYEKKLEDIYIPSVTNANREPVFITVVVPRDVDSKLKTDLLKGTAEIKLAASDNPELAIESLLTDTSSPDLYTEPDRRTIFSYLVDRGMTTICAGHGSYFVANLKNSVIDSGCQIFVSLNEQQRINFDLLNQEVRNTYRKYRKINTVLWVHSDGLEDVKMPQDWFDMVDLTGRSVLLVYLFLDDGPLLAVYRNTLKAPTLGNVSISGPRSASGLFFRFAGLSSKDRKVEDQIFLTRRFGNDPWTQSMSIFFSEENQLPSRSARIDESGAVLHFDGRTGARWTEYPLQSIRGRDDSLKGVGLEGSPTDEPAVDVGPGQ